MSVWATSVPMYHPWFAHPTMKRKFSGSATPDLDKISPSSASGSPPPFKRRRYSVLETGFAQLSLDNPIHVNAPFHSTASNYPLTPTVPYVSGVDCNGQDRGIVLPAMDADTDTQAAHVVLPSSIEEPSIPEVKMKSSTWYEPEPDRIVITDLDHDSDDEDNDSADVDTPSFSILPGLLEHIRSRSLGAAGPPISPPASTQALVLFRPLPRPGVPIPDSHEESKDVNELIITTDDRNDVVPDEDPMDVEP